MAALMDMDDSIGASSSRHAGASVATSSRVTIESLPSETLLHIAAHLESRHVAAARGTSRYLKEVFTSDLFWKQRCQAVLRRGPPIESVNLLASADPTEPWSTAFDPTSELHDPFDGNATVDWPVRPASQAYAGNGKTRSGNLYAIVDDLPPLSSFPGAQSYYDVFRTFVYPFGRLLGWWLSDSPSFGMPLRVVFASGNEQDGPRLARDDIDVEHANPRLEVMQPTFLCQKLQVVDRLRPAGPNEQFTIDWCRVTGIDYKKYGRTSHGKATLRDLDERIDLLYPGVKTEPVWEVSWETACLANNRAGRKVEEHALAVSPKWKGWDSRAHVISMADLDSFRMSNDGLGPPILDRIGTQSTQSQPSLLAQARALFATSRTNYMPDEERLFRFLQMSMAGRHPLLPHLRARHANALQVQTATHRHTVWLTSGAACTSPRRQDVEHDDSNSPDSTFVCLEASQPYVDTDTGLGFKPSSYAPAPSIAFPPPALLPLLRDILSEEDVRAPASYLDHFYRDKENVSLPALRMDPSLPYKLMPHFMDPLPTGPRFFPIRSPPLMLLGAQSTCMQYGTKHKDDSSDAFYGFANPRESDSSEGLAFYQHPSKIDPRIDPGSESFDWSCMEGLFAMSYGPWGQEVLYLRTRELTIHDFDPHDTVIEEVRWSLGEGRLMQQRPTGPHGTGHVIGPLTSAIDEGKRWGAEPYVSRVSPRDGSALPFVRPGCRVLEATKCTGDANVPRGAVTFRAFSKGAAADPRKEYVPPDAGVATHGPWTGEVDPTLPWSIDGPRPGRVLQHATGRLAPHLFVGGGNFRSCTLFLASPDEVYVCWHDLGKIAVAKRLTAC